MRTLAVFVLGLAAGCSVWPFPGASSDSTIPAAAVRTYAKAHGLSRDEARRELELFRDADTLQELRQSQAKKEGDGSQTSATTP